MGILQNFFQSDKREASAEKTATSSRRGALIHVFVFDCGPELADELKYATSLVRSLLPEVMAYQDLPVTFTRDINMPARVGFGRSSDIGTVTEYPLAWQTIRGLKPELVHGLRSGMEHYAFSWEEYCSESGNRGVLLAFYEGSA